MLENLTDRLSTSFRRLTQGSKLTKENMRATLKDVRRALIEADVAYDVVEDFIEQLKTKALGLDIADHLNAAQSLVKLVSEELAVLMGQANESLNLRQAPPAVVMMAGLQGSGKTTTTAKLAKLLAERESKKVAVVSTDVYRPAAITQLQRIAQEVGATWLESNEQENPVDIAKRALTEAKSGDFDVLIVDTAGRLHVDEEMMNEARAIHAAINPVETLFVVDGMTGQDAAVTAKAFNEALSLTGVVATKMDGDSRGGAILSIRALTGKPVKFIGVAEKMDGLEPFHPERMAQRILGMGDLLTLIEELDRKVDDKQRAKAEKIARTGKFTLEDLREQFAQMEKMGGMAAMMDKLPGMSGMKEQFEQTKSDKTIKRMMAIIDSMTKIERRKPELIKGGRKRRIAAGSGTDIPDVNRLLKQHSQMQKFMKKMKGGGKAKMMRDMKSMLGGGGMPPGGLPPGFGG